MNNHWHLELGEGDFQVS